jgi:hypothetical protein
MRTLIYTIFFLSILPVNILFAESGTSCSGNPVVDASKDYLSASEQEIALLGKQTFHAHIALVEKALQERGVSLPQNGYITSEFRSALIAFQESVGLEAKGEINQATLDKLGVKF